MANGHNEAHMTGLDEPVPTVALPEEKQTVYKNPASGSWRSLRN